MIQYYMMSPVSIKNSSGETIKVKEFRKRIRYSLNNIYLTKIKEDELIRPDVLSDRLYNDVFKVNGIIDANDIDIFSLDLINNFMYVSKERIQ